LVTTDSLFKVAKKMSHPWTEHQWCSDKLTTPLNQFIVCFYRLTSQQTDNVMSLIESAQAFLTKRMLMTTDLC